MFCLPEIQMKIRETKKRLEALRYRKRLLKSPTADAAADKKCTCESPSKTSKIKKEKKKKKKGPNAPKNIKCFYVHNNYWKRPPLWQGKNENYDKISFSQTKSKYKEFSFGP